MPLSPAEAGFLKDALGRLIASGERGAVADALRHLGHWLSGPPDALLVPRPVLYAFWEAAEAAPDGPVRAALLRRIEAVEYEFASEFGYVVGTPTPPESHPDHPRTRARRHRA